MKALKIFARIFFTMFFIVLIFVIVLILSYTLSSPDTTIGSDSRNLITGPWTEIVSSEDEDNAMKFYFSQDGTFQIVQGDDEIASGYFKIDKDSSKIKLLMLPFVNNYTDDFSKYVKYKVLAEISFSELEVTLDDDDEIIEGEEPTVSFLIRTNDGTDEANVYECQMNEVTVDLYGSEYDLTNSAS